MIVNLEAFHLHIDSIVENIAIEETPEATQEPEGEQQFQEESDNPTLLTTLTLRYLTPQQTKASPGASHLLLLWVYHMFIYIYLCIYILGIDWNPQA